MNSYPHLIPIKAGADLPPWLSSSDRRRLLRDVAEIHARTGARAWLDTKINYLCFGFVRPDGTFTLSTHVQFRRPDGTIRHFDPLLSDDPLDDLCVSFQRARGISPTRRESKRRSRSDEFDRDTENEMRNHVENANVHKKVHEDVERAYTRHSMGNHYRGKALVNGLKQGVSNNAR